VFSWNARNFMAIRGNPDAVRATPGGFVLWGGPGKDKPHEEGAFSATVSEPDFVAERASVRPTGVKVNCAWFRGGWFDPLTMAWRDIAAGACVERPPVTEGGSSPGASLSVPFKLGPRESRTIVLRFAWYVGQSAVRTGKEPQGAPAVPGNYRAWYAGRFADIAAVTDYWRENCAELRAKTQRFSDCFYDSTLPPEVIEAVGQTSRS